MKYKASEIVNRALSLADLHNTDFISHDENTAYLNDSWKEFYQLLINKGDKQFVKEVLLGGASNNNVTEYKLPDDLYQILSVKTANGSIITRKAESENNSSNTYEVFNDRIRLYGVANPVVMTYYTVPVYITYPDKEIVTEEEYSTDISQYSFYGNSYLKDNIVKNLVTGETVYAFTDEDLYRWLLGNNLYSNTNGDILQFNGTVIVQNAIYTPSKYFADRNNNKWAWSYQYKFQFLTQIFNPAQLLLTAGIDCDVRGGILYDTNSFIAYITQSNVNKLIYYSDGDVKILEDNLNYNYDNAFVYIDDHRFAFNDIVYELNDDYDITSKYKLPYKGIKMFPAKYGLVYYDGAVKIMSWDEDTEFNFPNELYVQVLAASLAVKYAMKQNANVEGLNNLYENYKSNFLNSLSQDSGFTRIQNVY